MASIIAKSANSSSGIHTALAGTLPDPYAIAYLRGGPRELLKLRLFELMQMGYLIVTERKKWTNTERRLMLAPGAPDWQILAPPDQYLLESFRSPRTTTEIYKLTFPPELDAACKQYRQELWQSGLLTGGLTPESDLYKRINSAISFLVFAAFVLGIMLRSGTVFFYGFAAAFVAQLFLRIGFAYRPSKQGKRYLKDLKRQYVPFSKFDIAIWELAPHATRVAAVAVFGVAILAGSRADALAALLGTSQTGSVEYGVEVGGGCGGCGGCGG